MKPGWYPDPEDDDARRYWDGETWSAPLPRRAEPLEKDGASDEQPLLPSPEEPPRGRRRLVLIASGVVVLLAIAAVVGLVYKSRSDEEDRRVAVAASKSSASAAAASSASAARAEKERADNLERYRREDIVSALEASVKKDARKSVRDDILDGPIKRVECTPVGGGSTDILTDTTGEFRCIAVNKTDDDGSESGYRYSATINWTEESYSWHLGD